MHDAGNGLGGENGIKGGGIAQVADDQAGLRMHSGAMPGAEVVEDDDIVAAFDQHVRDMTADIACAACNQDGHLGSLPFARGHYS